VLSYAVHHCSHIASAAHFARRLLVRRGGVELVRVDEAIFGEWCPYQYDEFLELHHDDCINAGQDAIAYTRRACWMLLRWRRKWAARMERRAVKSDHATVATFEEHDATLSTVKHNSTPIFESRRKVRHVRSRLRRRALHQRTARHDGVPMTAKHAHGSTARDEGEMTILAFRSHAWRRSGRRWFRRWRPYVQTIVSQWAACRDLQTRKFERAHNTARFDELDTRASRNDNFWQRCRWRRL